MKSINIILSEAFINKNLASERIAHLLDIPFINSGIILGKYLRKHPEKLSDFVENRIKEEELMLRLIKPHLSYPQLLIIGTDNFLTCSESILSFQKTVSTSGFQLTKIWVLKNDNLHQCIKESFDIKGYKSISNKEWNLALASARSVERELEDYLNGIHNYQIRELKLDSLKRLPNDFDKQVLKAY